MQWNVGTNYNKMCILAMACALYNLQAITYSCINFVMHIVYSHVQKHAFHQFLSL